MKNDNAPAKTPQEYISQYGSKSNAIRGLATEGMKTADISRALGIRYQHARNVLKRPLKKSVASAAKQAQGGSEWGDVAPDGRLLIPASFRKRLGLDEDGHVLMHVEDGELRVTSRKQALRQVQELVARYVPEGESLVDSLIADRRAEAAREEAND